jgi:type I restriction enzyme S subunit
MSRIGELLTELAPGGLEFVPLGELVRIRNGKDHKPLGDGNIPAYGTGGVIRMVDVSAHPGPSVLIPRKGSLDKLYYVAQPFWTVDTIFYTEIGDRLVPKFLYYYLEMLHLEKLNVAGGVPSLTQTELNRIRIPVPPTELQLEIVRALDLFQILLVELEAELDARRRQFAYYRDKLLAFREGDGVRWLPMGEIGTFTRGRRFTKNDMVPDGVPCIHYGEIYTHYGVSARETISHVRDDLAGSLRYAKAGDVVIASVGETVEDVAKAVAWLGIGEVAIHDDSFAFRSEQDPTYISYVMQTAAFHAQKEKHVARAKVKRVGAEQLGKVVIPVPTLDEQRRVVAILDKFDALVNNRSFGLPAEVDARRQQYVYYRDRLLAFEEAA